MGMALLVLIAGDFVSGVISLLFTFGAMLIGGIGIFLASDDRE